MLDELRVFDVISVGVEGSFCQVSRFLGLR
jgi:hypothetical protein